MKIYLLLLLCLLCVFNIGFSYADMIKIRPEGANVRSEANSSSQKIGSASGGHKYTVLNSNNGWYQIELENSNIGWVSGRMGTVITDKNKAEVNIQNTNQNVQDVSQNGKKTKDISSAESRRGYIISGTNVRSGPGAEYDKIGALPEKKEVIVYKSVNAEGDDWFEIGFEKDGIVQTGYVSAKKIKLLTSLKIYEGIYPYEEIISGTYQKKTNEIQELPSDGNVTIVYSDYGIYSGELKKSQRSGKGLFVWLNGDVYEGEWSKDKLNGNGKLRFSDGIVQEGIFRNSKLFEGTINKKQYEGSTVYRVVSKGSLKSYGTIVWPDGTVIEGSFDKKGVLKGKVTITYKNKGVKETYIGDLKNGKKSGKGTYTWGTGAANAFASKWASIRFRKGQGITDPETGAHRHPIDRHNSDVMARVQGLPRAIVSGIHTQALLAKSVGDWMGDAGFLRTLDCRCRRPLFFGDLSIQSGIVAAKYEKDGKYYVKLQMQAVRQDSVVHTTAEALVELPSCRSFS